MKNHDVYHNLYNYMLFNLGLPSSQLTNKTAVKAKIEELDNRFHLVMITELFDESITMLRRELCWSFSDVGSLRLNSVQKGKKSNISSEAKSALKKLFWPDYMLYNHFLAKLKARLKSELGKAELESEVLSLKSENDRVLRLCGSTALSHRTGHGQSGLRNADQCKLYQTGEVAFINMYREKQKVRTTQMQSLKGLINK